MMTDWFSSFRPSFRSVCMLWYCVILLMRLSLLVQLSLIFSASSIFRCASMFLMTAMS